MGEMFHLYHPAIELFSMISSKASYPLGKWQETVSVMKHSALLPQVPVLRKKILKHTREVSTTNICNGQGLRCSKPFLPHRRKPSRTTEIAERTQRCNASSYRPRRAASIRAAAIPDSSSTRRTPHHASSHPSIISLIPQENLDL